MKAINRQNRNGYTLIEMAMVLLIAGIALGAIFQGRELVENAKTKKIINDFENITQAYHAYIKRTGHPPGISRFAGKRIMKEEIGSRFFVDLFEEGFLPSLEPEEYSASVTLKHVYGDIWMISSSASRFFPFNVPQLCAKGLPLFVAGAIDSKLDDGVAKTGSVITRFRENDLRSYNQRDQMTERDAFKVCRKL